MPGRQASLASSLSTPEQPTLTADTCIDGHALPNALRTEHRIGPNLENAKTLCSLAFLCV